MPENTLEKTPLDAIPADSALPPEANGAGAAGDNNGNSASADDYTADKFKKLSDREHVRERYGMYIGDSSVQGLHHLVYELVNNSIDEVMAGFATLITVTINNDGSVSVEDDGRGIPVEKHE